ncbi:MAG TPA: FAD:protein FMN transferase [Actinokineospora sp.]|nr:FAD:protein FMN transferase [Actinokineospora sp.]
MTARAAFPALGTTAAVIVTDPAALDEATALLRAEIEAIDRTCSRFRPDSEITALHAAAGRLVTVSPLLAQALAVALRAARRTDGLVDPTVGAAVRAIGYDRDFAEIPADVPARGPVPVPGWHRVLLDPASASVLLPRGVHLDLGATAKALAADRAAYAIAQATGSGTLVDLGGDISTAGAPPSGGWQIALGDDHATAAENTVTVWRGGIASSGVARRHWRSGGRPVHHIIDPRTGDAAVTPWRTATVAARSCVDANTASTAAIVLGEHAPAWLAERAIPARLVTADGAVCVVGAWPADLVTAS